MRKGDKPTNALYNLLVIKITLRIDIVITQITQREITLLATWLIRGNNFWVTWIIMVHKRSQRETTSFIIQMTRDITLFKSNHK